MIVSVPVGLASLSVSGVWGAVLVMNVIVGSELPAIEVGEGRRFIVDSEN